MVRQITKDKAFDWYDAHRLRGNYFWVFHRKDTWKYYGVFEGSRQVACFGLTKSVMVNKAIPTRNDWESILQVFGSKWKLYLSHTRPLRLPYLTGMQVASNEQGKGYARIAINSAIQQLESDYLFLSSTRDSRAYQIYENAGFVDTCRSVLGRRERLMVYSRTRH